MSSRSLRNSCSRRSMCPQHILPRVEFSLSMRYLLYVHAACLSIDVHLLVGWQAGITTGLVVDCGESRSIVSAVQGGLSLGSAKHSNVSGSAIRSSLEQLILARHTQIKGPLDQAFLKSITDSKCLTAPSLESQLQCYLTGAVPAKEFQLPDGQRIQLSGELIRATEGLFDLGDAGSLPNLVQSQIASVPIDSRAAIAQHIVLAGGVSLLPGFADRLQLELRKILPTHSTFQLRASDHQGIAAWKGGCVLRSSPTFHTLCFTQPEFEEFGAGIIHRNRFAGSK
eukprot:m.97445 g.97445  ORF g.97445 m.97445 type:complete len:283 (+) comp51358_c0_seq4:325-1173(+)